MPKFLNYLHPNSDTLSLVTLHLRSRSGICNPLTTQQELSLNEMPLSCPKTIPRNPSPWKNCLPRDQFLVPKKLGTADLDNNQIKLLFLLLLPGMHSTSSFGQFQLILQPSARTPQGRIWLLPALPTHPLVWTRCLSCGLPWHQAHISTIIALLFSL